MSSPVDPVEDALRSIGGRNWPGDDYNHNLENRLMREFNTRSTTTSFLARHRVLLPALAVLIVAGVGFAATGGIAMIQSWFVTVSVDGEELGTQEVTLNPDGSAVFEVPFDHVGEGPHTIELAVEGEGYDGDGQKTVNVTLEDGVGQVELIQEDGGE